MTRYPGRLGLLGATAALTLGVAAAQDDPKGKVDPKINEQFQREGAAEGFIRRFESEDREVFARRDAIVAALGLRPGMAVADVGAGSGLFTRLMAEKVGPGGKVFAVDVSKDFLGHIARDAEKRGLTQVKTVLGAQDGTNLAPNSVDLVFLCDVYHHFERHEAMLESIKRALRPGGTVVLVEFDRDRQDSSEFVRKHVRSGQAQFRREFEEAGFAPAEGPKPELRENFFARFRKPAEGGRP